MLLLHLYYVFKAHALTPPIELSTPDPHKMTAHRLSRLELGLRNTESGLSDLSEGHDDSSLLEQFMEQLADHKREFSTIHEDLISLDLENDHELVTQHVDLERLQFESSHKVKKLMSTISKTNAPVADGKGVRLPKLDVPLLMVMYYTGPSFGNSSKYQYMTGLICQTLKILPICSKQLKMALLNLSSRDSHAQVRITMKPLTVSSRVSIILVFYIVLMCVRLSKLPP